MRQMPNRDAIFQNVRGASTITGWSMKAIRAGCQDGTIPHIKQGADYRINMPMWIEQLNSASRCGGRADAGIV